MEPYLQVDSAVFKQPKGETPVKLLNLLCLSLLLASTSHAAGLDSDAAGLAEILVSPELAQAKKASRLTQAPGRFNFAAAETAGSEFHCNADDTGTATQSYKVRFSAYGTRYDEVISIDLVTTRKDCGAHIGEVIGKKIVVTGSRMEEINRSVEKGGYSGAGGE
jgi:hypothetical protein